jgi:alginate O-acetyltransferase complex protein AlgJ
MNRTRRTVNVICCAAFVIALCAPGLAALLGFQTFESHVENRLPAPFPKMAWARINAFPRGVENWFADRFGFRRQLVRLASIAKVELRVSPSPRVVIGRGDWLFFAGGGTLDQYRRIKTFSKREVSGWREYLEARRHWLAQRGIHYLVAFPPNKEEIYSDWMPRELTRLRRPSQLDQVLQNLKSHSHVTTVDLRQGMARARKAGERVYHQTDTHWNGLGAFAAYSAIAGSMQQWFPNVTPMQKNAVVESRHRGSGGDLSGMLALPDYLPERESIEIAPAHPRAKSAEPRVTVPANTPPHNMPRAREVDDPALPRAIFLGDSFLHALVPLFAEHFSRSLFVTPDRLNQSLIERERPDIVIEERVERYLMEAVPSTPAELKQLAVPRVTTWIPHGMDEAHPPGTALPSITTWSTIDVERDAGGTLKATGPDPFVSTAVTPFDATSRQRLWVCFATLPTPSLIEARLMAQLFWSSNGAGFSEKASVGFPIVADARGHCYRVDPSLSREWVGSIGQIRLDFPNALPGLRYEVRSIERSD